MTEKNKQSIDKKANGYNAFGMLEICQQQVIGMIENVQLVIGMMENGLKAGGMIEISQVIGMIENLQLIIGMM